MNSDVHSGQIVFASATQGTTDERPWRFVLLDLATVSQRLLPEMPLSNGNRPSAPSWSPDGRRLLYSLNESCTGIFVYDFDTGRHERLDRPTASGAGCRAAWSPDGRFIAYQSSRDFVLPDPQQLFKMDREAAEALLLSEENVYVLDLQTRTHRQLTTKGGSFPAWSPDGQWILYYSAARQARRLRIRPDGSGDEEFPKLPDPRRRARTLSWSPDGKRMAFSAWLFPTDLNTMEASNEQVYTADSAGGRIELLTPEIWENAATAWAPQGNQIALVVNAKHGTGLASIRLVENGRSRQVVPPVAYWDDDYSFWSPNGRAIAYTPFNYSTLEGRGISIVNLDDGQVRQVVTDQLAAYPVWRPGRHSF